MRLPLLFPPKDNSYVTADPYKYSPENGPREHERAASRTIWVALAFNEVLIQDGWVTIR
jgi:hypothetical protein